MADQNSDYNAYLRSIQQQSNNEK